MIKIIDDVKRNRFKMPQLFWAIHLDEFERKYQRRRENLLKWWNNRTHVYQNWSMDRARSKERACDVLFTFHLGTASELHFKRSTTACKNVFTLFSMKMWFMQKRVSCFASWMCVCWLGCWMYTYVCMCTARDWVNASLARFYRTFGIVQFEMKIEWREAKKMRTNKWTSNNYALHEHYERR